MYERYTGHDHQNIWEHEAIVREVILEQEQGPIHIADLDWHRVLSPHEHFSEWKYPAITAVRKTGVDDYVVLVTKAEALVGHPKDIRVLGFDSTEARAMGLDLETAIPWPALTDYDIRYRLQYLPRGAYYCFYVTHDGYLTDIQPSEETYAHIPPVSDTALTIRALAAWRNTPAGVIPNQGGNRLVPASNLRPFLPY